MRTSAGLQGALPVIALYAFAGYRLMPALQQLYVHITQLRFAGPALDNLHQDLLGLAPPATQDPDLATAPLELRRAITLANITYAYPNAQRPAVQDLSLAIPAFSTIGLVGTTGSGKTTTVDIILGLLQPRSGQVAIDGTPITPENRRAWQRSLGYVPQQIYLADDTVAANIAYGMPPDRIDQQALEHAARVANLHDFVTQEMPKGYATLVGERGVRLSGGQRQRIGIARALYHQPQVLILDEATSALDNLTEQAVMDAVHALGHKITIILIAHRLTTVRECDRIYLLDKGRLTGQGTYEELLAASDHFRVMARAVAKA
jgi:ABC-type multidrug transport system fused ATPase/permease subunit